MNWTVGEVMRRESRSWRCMRRLVKYFNPGVCQAWQEWVKRHEKSLIWSLQVLNLTCLERVYNWFLDIGNTATVKRQHHLKPSWTILYPLGLFEFHIEQWRTLKPFCRMRSIILRTSDPKAVLIIWEPGGTTCIGCKLGDLISTSCHVIIYWNMSHQVAPIALDENLATTWHHLHWEQLALIENLAIRQHLLHWLKIRPSCSCPPPPCPPCPDHHV